MTKPDYRALCAELVDAILTPNPYNWEDSLHDSANRARALLAEPVAEGPTVMEIIELHSWLEDEWRANNDGEDLPTLDFARAVLARWGRPTPQPVAVSERLPGPGDVNEDGNCWLWDREGCFWDWTYIRTRTRAEMYTYTHWLPANALPTPEATND